MQIKSTRHAKFALLLGVLMLGAVVSESALAQHRHHHRGGARIGLYIGAPALAYSFYRPYYYSPYYYPAYYPPVAVAPPAPPVYVEQPQVQQQQPYVVPPPQPLTQSAPQPQYQPQFQPEPAQAAPQPGNMWYYCSEARAYYPYVKQCPAGWQQVTPQPQS
jgi:hypothetical protein